MNKEELIEQLVTFRKEKKISQKQLSEMTGISQQAISKLEQPDSNPTLDTLLAIAEALRCKIELIDRLDSIIKYDTSKAKINRTWLNVEGGKEYTLSYIYRKLNENAIEEMDKYICNIHDSIYDIADKKGISFDIIDIIEMEKDFDNIFEKKKNLINIELIKKLHEEVECVKEAIDELASDFCYLEEGFDELIAILKDLY